MSDKLMQHADALSSHFGDKLMKLSTEQDEISIQVAPSDLREVCLSLHDEEQFAYQQLVDLCGVDYSQYGNSEWQTNDSTSSGFSRGVDAASMGRLRFGDELEKVDEQAPRYASVMHLISYRHNRRLRVKTFAEDNNFPVIPSVTAIWASADWYEREAFDLFGILYSEHPDLRHRLRKG